MSIVNDMWIPKVRNNPTWVQYNVDYAAAPRTAKRTAARGSSWPAPVYWANSQQWLYGYSNNGNISSNYNPVRRMTGMWNYIGNNRWYNNYWAYNGWYSGWYTQPTQQYKAPSNYKDYLYRIKQDYMAWYNTPKEEITNYVNMVKNDPEARAYTLWVLQGKITPSIDYDIPQRDNNRNYMRRNLENPSEWDVAVPRVFTRYWGMRG